jgi:putative effector of murein hydrolase
MTSELAQSALWQAILGFKWNWIGLTVLVYAASVWLLAGNRRLQWLNPVLLGMAGVILILVVTGIPYTTYFSGAQLIHELLGPATVALAIPVARQLRRMTGGVAGFALAAAIGSAASIATVWLVAVGMGVSADALVPLSVKSVTMPIALTITESAGASVSLAATFVMLTGLLGSVLAQPILKWTRLADDKSLGFALGVCAHGIGAARGFQLNEQTGAYAVLGMGMAGILTSVGLPLVLLAMA